MVETFTPAGCGGRHRRSLAVALFTLGAITGAAAVGALAGALGALIPGNRWRIAVAIGIVGVAFAREAGLARIPVPGLKRQVPEAWRRRFPLAVWSTGYGLILGAGLGTYQPVATLWATLAAIVATGHAALGALCMAGFGLARGIMVGVPVAALVARSRPGRSPLRRANLTVLAAVMAALVPQAARGQAAALAGTADPTVSAGATAVTVYAADGPSVLVNPPGQAPITISGVREPSLSTDAIAVVTPAGVEVRFWRTGQVVLAVPGATRPALAGRSLTFVRRSAAGSSLVLRDISTGAETVLARAGRGVDLGRAALSGRLVTWHEQSGRTSRIMLRTIGGTRTTVVAQTRRRYQVGFPSLARGRLVWVESDAERSWLVTRRVGTTRGRVIATGAPGEIFTTTATDGTRAWVTGWRLPDASVRVVSVPLAN